MKFLIVDDNRNDQELISRHLKKEFEGCSIVTAGRRDEFDAAMSGQEFDLVITDYQLRWTDGLKILQTIKGRLPHVPVVMVTDSGNEEVAVDGMKAGLSDYVLKRHLKRLPVAVKESLEKKRLAHAFDEAVKQLQVSEERCCTISELTSDYTYVLEADLTGDISCQWVTDAFTSVTGYGRDEINAEGWLSIVHPGDIPMMKQRRERVLAGQPDACEYRIITKSGEMRWLHDYCRPVLGPEGDRVVRIYGASQDITEKRRVIEDLEKYRFLISEISDLVYICDTEGNIRYVNPIFGRLTGRQPKEFIGRSFAPLFDEENLKVAMDVYSRTLRGESPQYELAFSDTGIVCEYKNFPFRDENGVIIGVIGIARDVSERRRAEEALRRYEQIVSTTRDHMSFVDRGYVYRAVNDAYLIAHRSSRDEIVGHSVPEIMGQEVFDSLVKANLDRCLDGRDVRYSAWFEFAGTGRRYMDVTYSPHVRADGSVSGVVVNSRDVTEHVEAKEALRESESRLRAIIDAEPECVKVLDSEGRVIELNRAGLAMIEANRLYDIMGKSMFPLVVAEHQDEYRRHVQRIFEGEKDSLEFEIIGLKGTRRWLETHAVPLRDETGLVVSLLSITRDISERKKGEAALLEEKQRLEDVTRHINCGLFLLDEEARVAYANTVAEEWFGRLEDVRGRPCWELFGMKNPAGECAGLKVVKTGEVARSEAFTRVVSGEERSFYVIASPVKDALGRVRQVTEVVIDITERKRLEEQILHMQKMESLGQLASGIAHDFNNVLGGILGYTDLCLMKIKADHPMHENLSRIMELGHKAAGITRQLLAFSRRQVLEKVDVDINALVANLFRLVDKSLGEHVEVKFLPGTGLGSVHADPGQIEQVLLNLCVNARDAMPRGGSITITTTGEKVGRKASHLPPDVAPGEYVVMSVSDTGQGMTEEVRERIFEPFFTTKETGKGTGLGLSIVYGIVGQHNGFMYVKSEVEKGSTFFVYLPASLRPPLTSDEVKAEIPWGTETVLLVEDDSALCDSLAQVLEGYGYTVLTAATGEEGYSRYAKDRAVISMVISDLVMPVMSGMEMYQRILELNPAARFLFISGYVPEGEYEDLILSGEIGFLYKPFSPQVLAQRVREVLDTPGE